MGVSGVTSQPMSTAMQSAMTSRAEGLSKQDQVGVIAARPSALRNAAVAASNLVPADGSASGQGPVDMYL